MTDEEVEEFASQYEEVPAGKERDAVVAEMVARRIIGYWSWRSYGVRIGERDYIALNDESGLIILRMKD